MTRMARTNYWNPSVKYIGKNSAQNFMKSAKAKLVGAGVKVVPAVRAHLAAHLVANTGEL